MVTLTIWLYFSCIQNDDKSNKNNKWQWHVVGIDKLVVNWSLWWCSQTANFKQNYLKIGQEAHYSGKYFQFMKNSGRLKIQERTDMKTTMNNKSLSRLMCKVEWFTGNISLVKAYSHGSDKAEQSYSPFFGTNITVRIRHLCHFLTQPQMNHIEEMHVLNKKHQKQIAISKEIWSAHCLGWRFQGLQNRINYLNLLVLYVKIMEIRN